MWHRAAAGVEGGGGGGGGVAGGGGGAGVRGGVGGEETRLIALERRAVVGSRHCRRTYKSRITNHNFHC